MRRGEAVACGLLGLARGFSSSPLPVRFEIYFYCEIVVLLKPEPAKTVKSSQLVDCRRLRKGM